MSEWTPTPPGTICQECQQPIVNEACRCGIRGPGSNDRTTAANLERRFDAGRDAMDYFPADGAKIVHPHRRQP
jgi:hypothetical protein